MTATKAEGPSCRRCRHWGEVRPFLNRKFDGAGLRRCERVGLVAEDDEPAPDTLAFTADPEEYFSMLMTRPEFHCAHFEETDRG